MNIEQLIIALAPTVVGLVERIFSKQAKSGPQKAALALNIAQAAVVTALGLDASAFGPPEQALVKSINDALVAYYNAKGWPTA